MSCHMSSDIILHKFCVDNWHYYPQVCDNVIWHYNLHFCDMPSDIIIYKLRNISPDIIIHKFHMSRGIIIHMSCDLSFDIIISTFYMPRDIIIYMSCDMSSDIIIYKFCDSLPDIISTLFKNT